MTIQPVDVFMSNNSDGGECPISVLAIFGGMLMGVFQEMDATDLERWTEINYTGFVGEISDVIVTLDVGPDSILGVVDDEDEGKWQFELSGEFLAH